MVNEDQNAEPLLGMLIELPDSFSSIDMTRLRQVDRRSVVVNCNWKAAIDAFLEVYHTNSIHPDTVGSMLDREAAIMTLFQHGHSRMATRCNLDQGVNFGEYGGA